MCRENLHLYLCERQNLKKEIIKKSLIIYYSMVSWNETKSKILILIDFYSLLSLSLFYLYFIEWISQDDILCGCCVKDLKKKRTIALKRWAKRWEKWIIIPPYHYDLVNIDLKNENNRLRTIDGSNFIGFDREWFPWFIEAVQFYSMAITIVR